MFDYTSSLSDKPTLPCRGRWLTHTSTQSDLEGPEIQLNPVLIQASTPCVPLSLLCSLYNLQHKANPGLSQSGNEIRYSAPNVFRYVLQQALNFTNLQDFQLSKLEELGFQRSFQKLNYSLVTQTSVFMSDLTSARVSCLIYFCTR